MTGAGSTQARMRRGEPSGHSILIQLTKIEQTFMPRRRRDL